jgi:hypothetical protein
LRYRRKWNQLFQKAICFCWAGIKKIADIGHNNVFQPIAKSRIRRFNGRPSKRFWMSKSIYWNERKNASFCKMKWMRDGFSDECLLIFRSDVLTNSIACNSGSGLAFRELGKRLGSFLSYIRKSIRLKKHVQLVKLPTRSQTRRVKLYSIESQN